jgi:hypothetical protein
MNSADFASTSNPLPIICDPMNRFHIKIINDDKATIILNLLRELPFVEIEEVDIKVDKSFSEKSRGSLADLFGLWEHRNITLQDIREKAWDRK